jgi:hypothetical protein
VAVLVLVVAHVAILLFRTARSPKSRVVAAQRPDWWTTRRGWRCSTP